MSVAEKRSDIASLRVLGLTPANIRAVFMLHGLYVALLGIAGLVLGLVVTNLEAFMRVLDTVFGWTLFDPDVYYIGGLPTDLQWRDVTYILIGSLVLVSLQRCIPRIVH